MERLTSKSPVTDMVWFIDHENSDMFLEPCEMNAHHNRLAIQRLNTFEESMEYETDKAKIDTLKSLRKSLLERVAKLEEEYRTHGRNETCNRIMEANEIISMIQEEVEKISPADCDW